jgi:hypothetical protein
MKYPAMFMLLLIVPFLTSFQSSEVNSFKESLLRCPASVKAQEERLVLGHLETVKLGESQEMAFEAKIDSGAEVSSLHAEDIHAFTEVIFEKGQKKEILFVRFKTVDDRGHEKKLVKLVSRVDQVKSASGISTRYFFKESLWIKNNDYEVEINLADRSQLSRKFLIGRNILNQGYLIDTSRSYLLTKSLKP